MLQGFNVAKKNISLGHQKPNPSRETFPLTPKVFKGNLVARGRKFGPLLI